MKFKHSEIRIREATFKDGHLIIYLRGFIINIPPTFIKQHIVIDNLEFDKRDYKKIMEVLNV